MAWKNPTESSREGCQEMPNMARGSSSIPFRTHDNNIMEYPSDTGNGLPLQDAIEKYSDSEGWEAYQDAARRTSRRRTIASGIQADESIASYRSKVSTGFRTRREDDQRKRALFWQIRRAFQEKLVHGDLVAFGYNVPRSPYDERVRLPNDIWHERANLDWEASTAEADGLKFVSVLVFEASADLPEDLARESDGELPLPQMAPRIAPGPLPLAPEIEKAYESLDDRNAIDYGQPINRLYKPIRKAVHESKGLGPEAYLRGLGDETIRKVISPLFHAAKDMPLVPCLWLRRLKKHTNLWMIEMQSTTASPSTGCTSRFERRCTRARDSGPRHISEAWATKRSGR